VAACGNQISYREDPRLGGTPEAPHSQARSKEYSNPTKYRSSQIAPRTAAKYVESFPRKTLEAFGIDEVDAHQVGGFLMFDAPRGDLSCHYLRVGRPWKSSPTSLDYMAKLWTEQAELYTPVLVEEGRRSEVLEVACLDQSNP